MTWSAATTIHVLIEHQIGARGRFTLRQASGEVSIRGVEGDTVRVRADDDEGPARAVLHRDRQGLRRAPPDRELGFGIRCSAAARASSSRSRCRMARRSRSRPRAPTSRLATSAAAKALPDRLRRDRPAATLGRRRGRDRVGRHRDRGPGAARPQGPDRLRRRARSGSRAPATRPGHDVGRHAARRGAHGRRSVCHPHRSAATSRSSVAPASGSRPRRSPATCRATCRASASRSSAGA